MSHELVPYSTTAPTPSHPSMSLVSKPTSAPTALAPGFRFHPTDEELVIYYLKRKVCRKPFKFNAISDVDIYKSEPWDLGCKSSLKSRDQEYYFFSALDKKYGNGARMNRATNVGYWKATGNDRPVKHNSKTVGMKKTLVFHSGRAPDGKRTNWVMHEYRLVDTEMERPGSCVPQDAYVLCRVFHKSNIGPPNGHRYAPFVEEEWDDDKLTFVPGEMAREETSIVHDSVGNYGDVLTLGNGHDSIGIQHAVKLGHDHDLVGGNSHDAIGGNHYNVVMVGNGHGSAVGGNQHDFLMLENCHHSIVGGNHRGIVTAGNGHDSVVGDNCRGVNVVGNGHDSVAGGVICNAVVENGLHALNLGNVRDIVAGNAHDASVGGNGHAAAFIEQEIHDAVHIDEKYHVPMVVEQKGNAVASVEIKDPNVSLGENGHGLSVDRHAQNNMMEVDDHEITKEGNVDGSIGGDEIKGCSAAKYNVQDTQTISNALLNATELPKEDQSVLKPCKTEKLDDDPMTCVVNREERLDDYPSPVADEPQPLLSLFNQQPGILRQYKRRRHNEPNPTRSNVSEISSAVTHDPCSSTTTTASTQASVMASTKRNFLSALVEFQLLESLEPKDKTPVAPPELSAALHDSSVPSSCLKYIESLQNEIHKISIEKETLKFEMLSAQAVINILQSRIDLLNKENEELKNNVREAA